jgi:hypothetical protein
MATVKEIATAESFHIGFQGEKAWNRFEDAFIAEVSAAVDRLEASFSGVHPRMSNP